ncbi:WYL domain-containing protein [Kaistia adipata]|uniref:WYL domain-containing protein n=1 Tax=Kaistia adipata TaxID=166954 RepID=UPI00048E0E1B|nr:WYL domain-containing protein [Kaistia adipata]
MMAWIIGFVVVLLVLAMLGRSKCSTPPTTDTQFSHKTITDHGDLRIVTEASMREYNPHAYRFDGLAYPEFRITYADEDGVVTEREIYVDGWRKRGAVTYYFCWCFERDDRRTFRSDRILEIVNVQTGRQIKDIVAYRTR